VLTSLKDNSLFCQLPECEFAPKNLRYLGHLVSGEGIRPDPKRWQLLSNGPLPQILSKKCRNQKRPIATDKHFSNAL
jgi:hypothetical protein